MTESEVNDVKPKAELASKITEQVEYYFGDINLPRDKFIQEEMKKDDGWIPLTVMLKFKRLASLTTDVNAIAEALQSSLVIDVDDGKEKIRRNPDVPLPENTLEYWQEIKRRTVYIKGFPTETPLDEILEFVKAFGPVKNVLMRRTKPGRVFKGSVFATFADREAAEKFIQNEGAKEFKGAELTKLMQDDYWAKKQKETKERRQAEKNIKNTKKNEALEEQKKSALGAHFIKGLVLNVSGLPAEGKTTIHKLKDFFKAFGDVAFAVYENNEDSAQIRFSSTEENAAQKAWDAAVAAGKDGDVIFEGAKLSAQLLQGEDEDKYWLEFTKQKVAKNERFQNNKQNRGRGQNKHKRQAPRDRNEEAETKKSKRTVFNDDDAETDAPKAEKAENGTAAKKEEPAAAAQN